ncbi:MAG: peptidoglycan DD-metalloendopeptidase family protein [Bacteroidales bacterium]|nr:peptidoglycan DD-metalloendopeptidase family protein [Bacteroidales bacterium]
MSKHTQHFVVFLLSIVFCSVGIAQNNKTTPTKPQKSEVRVNRMDVIYDEDDEYIDILTEPQATTTEQESYMYERPPLLPPPPMEDADNDEDPDMMPQVLQTIEDEGAESEDEILYASFDSSTIHYPKLDVNTITEPIHIMLTHPERGEEYAMPIGETARASSHFGPRRRRFHYGLDIAAPKGEPIYAMFDGTVRISVRNRSYGNLVVIRHNNGLETYYAHMSARHVQPGDEVKAGDCIGLCGNTGRSYGSHLHLEIRYMGNAMNPESVIDPNTRQLLANDLTLTKDSFRKTGRSSRSSKGKASTSKGGKQYYRVRKGDNLSKIASRNGTTVRKLKELNHLKSDRIREGQQLRVK